jgi:hypothetical protein
MRIIILGGKEWVVPEPVFRDLKIILACLNRLNNKEASDVGILNDVQSILVRLLGERHVKKFRRYCWEAWKIPTPSPDEITALLAVIPEICGLQASTATSSVSASKNDDWDALYWRVIRQTGWTWETVDTTMTMSRLAAMQENLNQSPAVESLVAAYLGYDYTPTETLENKIDNWLASQGKDNG